MSDQQDAARWRIGPVREIVLDRPRLMGIVNATPDSFSDGGRLPTVEAAVAHALRLVEEGADVIDVGGESTRPGAEPVDADEQIRRVVPVIEGILARCDAALSVDTTRAAVAAAALDAGAEIVNDVSAGTDDPALLPLVAARDAGVILMHRRAAPRDDSYSDRYARDPDYQDVTAEVRAVLLERARAALDAGVDRAAIVLDPGLGFGKSVEQNYRLIAEAARLRSAGFPLLAAASRKSFLGAVSGERDPGRRDLETVAVAVIQWRLGYRLFRVHDVAATRRGLAVAAAASVEPEDEGATIRPSETNPTTRTGASGMAIDLVHEFTDSNFETEVLQSEKPVLVDFWAEWCQPCRMLAPTIDEIAQAYEGKAKVGKVDTDSNRDISVKYGISAIPTVILFKDGEVQKKFVGLTKKEEFAKAIDEFAG